MITVPGSRRPRGRPQVNPKFLAMAAAEMHQMGKLDPGPKADSVPSYPTTSPANGTVEGS